MKKDIKEMIIEKIMEVCDKEQKLPWSKGILNKVDFAPINFTNQKRYRGFNRLLLTSIGVGTNEYLTFKQCQALGGKVKKGEKSFPIVFYMLWNKKTKKAAEKGDNNEDIIPLMKYFNVFEISQTTLKPKRTLESKENKKNLDIEKFVSDFAKETNVKIENVFKANKTASYSPSQHKIEISDITLYESPEEYYATLFHEMIHSTGTKLKRKFNTMFGSEIYSKEEVVAETGAMFLCSIFGINKNATTNNNLAYIKGWSKNLRENPDWLISGANAAEKAVEFMLNVTKIKIDGYNSETETEEKKVS